MQEQFIRVIFYAFTCVVEYITLVIFLNNFMYRRYNFFFLNIFTGFSYIIVLIIINSKNIIYVNMMTLLVLSILVSTIFFKDIYVKKILLSLVFSAIGITSELLTISIFELLNLNLIFFNSTFFIGGLISKLLLFIYIFIIILSFSEKKFLNSSSQTIPLLGTSIFIFLSTLFIYSLLLTNMLPKQYQLLSILILFGFLSFHCFIIYIYSSVVKTQELFTENEMNKQYVVGREMVYLEQQKNVDKILGVTHDMKNHILNLEYLWGRENNEAKTYQKEILTNLDVFANNSFENMNNFTLSLALLTLKNQCREFEIDLILNLKCRDFDFLSPYDTTSIFGNLVDNAVEACKLLESKRKIFLSTLFVKNHILIICENNKSGELLFQNNSILSKKRGNGLKGYGLDIIRKSAEKYGGDLSVQYNNSYLRLTIWLKPSL